MIFNVYRDGKTRMFPHFWENCIFNNPLMVSVFSGFKVVDLSPALHTYLFPCSHTRLNSRMPQKMPLASMLTSTSLSHHNSPVPAVSNWQAGRHVSKEVS